MKDVQDADPEPRHSYRVGRPVSLTSEQTGLSRPKLVLQSVAALVQRSHQTSAGPPPREELLWVWPRRNRRHCHGGVKRWQEQQWGVIAGSVCVEPSAA